MSMLSTAGEEDGTGGVVPSKSVGGVQIWSKLPVGGMTLVVKRQRLGVATCGLLSMWKLASRSAVRLDVGDEVDARAGLRLK